MVSNVRVTGHVIGLDLSSSYIYGSINSSSSLFRLVHLEKLNLADNDFNYSQISPGIRYLSNLTYLNLSMSLFSGQIPPEIFELSNLVSLDLSFNPLKLQKPGLKSLVENLTSLKLLYLCMVNISSSVPHILVNLSSLTSLGMRGCGLYGEFPMEIFKLRNLQFLSVRDNENLTGYLPEFHSSNSLQILRLANTGFSGELPNLEYLSLIANNLSGRVELDSLLKLKNLTQLQLSGVHLSFPNNSTFNTTIPKLKLLMLELCNLTEFPNFLRYQNELELLDLSYNNIHGQIPKWIFNIGKETLVYLELNFNYLPGFESFEYTPLDSDNLQGSLPIPPPSIASYSVRNNTLTGEIPPLFCNLSSIIKLDLSHNNLSGILPQCLCNVSKLLTALSLQNNHFNGTLPATYVEGSKLEMMDVSYNQLEGQIPRSLSNCTMLQILRLVNNRFSDIFPSWLGKLPKLRVLSLRSNEFHGIIGKPESSLEFPKLQVIDVSFNKFTGKLPSEHIQSWNSMKVAKLTYGTDNVFNVKYMIASTKIILPDFIFPWYVVFSMEMTYKGVQRTYETISEIVVFIDLSSNRFEGQVPEDIGCLKGLHLLNLSNNILIGHIPSSIGNLTELESLDLSQNRLSREIPQQFLQLTFLEFFNASNNYLTGPMPQGQQFSTFQNDSYLGNTGLCGMPLTKKCKISETLTQPPSPPLNSKHGEGSNFPSKSDWVVLMMGYESGLIIGFVIGDNLTVRKLERFLKNFLRKQ
ncbi:hypothetical protein ACJW31_03G066000 [Castanea mollissima]